MGLVLQQLRCDIYSYNIMNNQQQECVKIEVDFPNKKDPTPAQVRNRRFKKLQELRDSGFFSEDSIKLRHPLLYHNYLGNHSQKNRTVEEKSCTLSQFLQKNLINLEYRQRLAEELGSKIEDENEINKKNSEENWQVLEEMVGEMTLDKDGLRNNPPVRSWQVVEEEQIELEEENLIDHAEQLFMEGKIEKTYVNYAQIDNCSDYDSVEEQNREAQEKYFCGDVDEEEDERVNRDHYTGIQDY